MKYFTQKRVLFKMNKEFKKCIYPNGILNEENIKKLEIDNSTGELFITQFAKFEEKQNRLKIIRYKIFISLIKIMLLILFTGYVFFLLDSDELPTKKIFADIELSTDYLIEKIKKMSKNHETTMTFLRKSIVEIEISCKKHKNKSKFNEILRQKMKQCIKENENNRKLKKLPRFMSGSPCL